MPLPVDPPGRGRLGGSGLRAAAVAAACFPAFLPVLWNGFVNWDDLEYVARNPGFQGLGWANLRWMLGTAHMGNYTPLTWLSLALDHAAWGLKPAGYHLTSLLIHCVNAALVYTAAKRLIPGEEGLVKDASAAFAALAWAVHPLRVESVAWVSERRDVLSGMFCLLSLDSHLRERRGAALAAFAAALLSKGSVLGYPLALAALDAWRGRSAWAGKLPYLAAAAAAGAVNLAAQAGVGAVPGLERLGLPERLAQAGYGLGFYLARTAWPAGLAPLYPRPGSIGWTAWPYAGGLALATALSVAFWRGRRAWPAGLAAWLAYVSLLLPVLGLVAVGPQRAADRYSYLSCLPWTWLAGAGLGRGEAARPALRTAMAAGAVGLLVLSGAATARQTRFWRDSETLWRRVLAVEPGAMAHNYLGVELARQGRTEEGEGEFRRSLAANPEYADARRNLADALARLGRREEAVAEYREALRRAPGEAETRFNLGAALYGLGRRSEAEAAYREALRLDPSFARARASLDDLERRRPRP